MLKNTHTEINLRLKMLYDMIPDCTTIGDVGTDHGFLPIYAVENGRCKYAIASDLREGPLKIAKTNIINSELEDYIQTMLCPGLEGYIDKDCEVVVIAGMGGITLCGILDDWIKLCKSKNYFPGNISYILQPNTHEHLVRQFLWDNGFDITCENSVRDGAHVYLGLKCTYDGIQRKDYTQVDCYVGKIMSIRMNDNDIVYYENLLNKHKHILSGLLHRIEPDKETSERINLSKMLIKELNDILKLKD